MADTDITLQSDDIAATIRAAGAELCSLQDRGGTELLWQAGPQWPRHAPVLFPIVGRLDGDQLRHRGQIYPMTQHGFARDQPFDRVERDATSCRLLLTDTAATRAHYPFRFRLEISYAVDAEHLDIGYAISNPSDEVLPASIGAHPAFNWPLLPQLSKQDYGLDFSEQETAPIRRLTGGLLREQPEPNPIQGRALVLTDELFAQDAMIIDRPASSSVRFAASTGPAIEVSWRGFRQLGLWSKPGAPFLCIEPWRGFASPAGFDGEFSEKPGLMLIEPGGTETLSYRISVRR